ncbi:MAG: efflux RND transporter periplasmic adaptor subunit [Prevotellaceae bacterium]|jgi:membrane fusion protein (multidrug efflux system)|nr:efflux RND transporter periplasmic adaptor subunit [Prevotellaceae bacterium]
MDKRVRWGIIILLVIGLTGWGVYRFLPRNNSNEDNVPPAAQSINSGGAGGQRILNVDAVVIRPETLADDYSIKSRLLPDAQVDLTFQTSGQVTHIYFAEGTAVKEGDLLAKINDAPLQAQLERLQAQLPLAEDRLSRQSTLLEKDAVSKEAYEQVKTDLAVLHADIQQVRANIALTELRAPFDGVIGLRQVSEGAYATPSVVIAPLTKIAPLKIEFSVPEKYTNTLHVGTKVIFTIENDLETYEASVYAIDSKIDAETNTFGARALYANADKRIRPGRTANLTIRMWEEKDAIAIPTEAIVPEMGVAKVFLYKSGKAEPVTVTQGLRTAAQVQVIEGLQFGDTLIVSGTLQLRSGLPVRLDNVK